MHGEIKKQARLSEWLQSCPFTQKKTDVYLGGKRQRVHLMEVTRWEVKCGNSFLSLSDLSCQEIDSQQYDNTFHAIVGNNVHA